MIPYVEIKDKYTLKTVAMVEPQECWFELSYQDIGEFEVYCRATKANLTALQKGQFVKIPNKRFIWVITSLQYTFTAGGARMISAKGYEAKWLLNKRCIQTPKALQGTITSAIYGLVNANMGTGASAARKINGFVVDTNELLIDISGTQAPRGNLLEFVQNILKNYNCGSQVIFENGKLKYQILSGRVLNHIIFSQALDNLLASERITDDTNIATNALVVSTVDVTEKIKNDNGEEVEIQKSVDYAQTYDTGETGIDRGEIFIKSDLSTTYEDANGEEKETTPTSALYKGWQIEEGKNKLTEHKTIEETSGEIDIINSRYEFDVDFYIGDMVRVQDEYFNLYMAIRIAKYTMKQDANGYGEEAEYGA